MEYLKRVSDKLNKEKLEERGAVLIEGAKWCGKSTSAIRFAKKVINMQDPDKKDQNIELAKSSASTFLSGDTPLLIDEWQEIPFIWDAIRYEVDKRDKFGQFILTGSVVPPKENAYSHSGIGRITRMHMRPMSLYESQDSNGKVSLKDLFENKNVAATCDKSLQDIAFMICRGGWPKSINQKERIALNQAKDYFEELISSDISRLDGVKRDKMRVKAILKSYARQICTQCSVQNITQDVAKNEGTNITRITIESYLNALRKLYVIEEMDSWSPKLRSKVAMRTTKTRYFVDPSIATASLGLSPSDLIDDLKTYGLLFENLCVRDLRVYVESMGGEVFHYRNKDNFEIDSILHLNDGSYGLVEVKLASSDGIEEGARHLLQFKKKIDTDNTNPPSFLMILTATNNAYRREDGVYVVPITCLKD